MEFTINQYTLGQRPSVSIPSKEFYEAMGEEGIRKMVSSHYDLLTKSAVNHLFPKDQMGLEVAKKHSADFFIQICGGPDYYNQNRGNPMLIKRHAPFTISADARRVWLQCYIQVISELEIPEVAVKSFWDYLNVFSSWMVNTSQ